MFHHQKLVYLCFNLKKPFNLMFHHHKPAKFTF